MRHELLFFVILNIPFSILLLHNQKKVFLRLSFTSKKNISRTSDYAIFFGTLHIFKELFSSKIHFHIHYLHSYSTSMFFLFISVHTCVQIQGIRCEHLVSKDKLRDVTVGAQLLSMSLVHKTHIQIVSGYIFMACNLLQSFFFSSCKSSRHTGLICLIIFLTQMSLGDVYIIHVGEDAAMFEIGKYGCFFIFM